MSTTDEERYEQLLNWLEEKQRRENVNREEVARYDSKIRTMRLFPSWGEDCAGTEPTFLDNIKKLMRPWSNSDRWLHRVLVYQTDPIQNSLVVMPLKDFSDLLEERRVGPHQGGRGR